MEKSVLKMTTTGILRMGQVDLSGGSESCDSIP